MLAFLGKWRSGLIDFSAKFTKESEATDFFLIFFFNVCTAVAANKLCHISAVGKLNLN